MTRGSIPILASVNYADIALKNFFDSIKNEEWYQNTLFVITADHTSDHFLDDYSSGLGLYRVPLIFFHPNGSIPAGETLRNCPAHGQRAPTVLDYLGILEENKKDITPFGQSLLNPQREGFALIHTNGIFNLVTQSGKTTYNRSQNAFTHSKLKEVSSAYQKLNQVTLTLKKKSRTS